MIRVGSSDSIAATYEFQDENGILAGIKSLADGASASFEAAKSGRYFLKISHNGDEDDKGTYEVSFEGINDKPTDLQITEQIEELDVDTDLSQLGMKVGVLTITDDPYGTHTIELTGGGGRLV